METEDNFQQKLPLMPVPEVNTTCQKLLKWVEPLLSIEKYQDTKVAVKQFLADGGEAQSLQSALLQWIEQNPEEGWSSTVWKDLYLQSRNSLVINSNVFYYLKSKLNEHTSSQARIATALISSVYQFIGKIDKNELPVDKQKNQPLCMSQYSNIFSSIRRPCPESDEFEVFSSRTNIIVLHNKRIYSVEISERNGHVRPTLEIESDLELILSESGEGSNIGILTTTEREQWAMNRQSLVNLSTNNQNSIKAIEEAAFALCLDQQSPEELVHISQQLLHGSGSDRYFDKSLQFIVFKNGKTGINFEHTGVDGSVMLQLVAHIYDTIDKVSFEPSDSSLHQLTQQMPTKNELLFDLSDEILQEIYQAESAFLQHISNTQTRILNFTQFGKDQIKKFAVSPDAFVQLAFQLAEFKLYGKCFSAYEAVMTRTFQGGRIDVLYTVSQESMTFISNMLSDRCDNQTKIASLRKAIQKHLERAAECRAGEGVYTHFLALQYCYPKSELSTIPSLFSHEGYKALTESVVCTSTTSEYGVDLAGYGPIVDHGYGIRYFTKADAICFNMTSRTVLTQDLEQMRTNIEESLIEMASVMSETL